MNQNCKCGYDINHPNVVHKTEYSKLGWFLFTLLGLSAKPKKVKFICSECKETVFITTKSEMLSKYVGR